MSDISYELAKKLWDAGYPFKRRDSKMSVMCLCTKDVCDGMFGREFRFDGNLYPEPTLEEIIEEIGKAFRALYAPRDSYAWVASGSLHDCSSFEMCTEDNHEDGYGATPKIALINLYLALKRK